MKALILAGGKATRMGRHITGAKQLIEVNGKSTLYYVIDKVVDLDICDIGIVISPETGNQVRRAVHSNMRLWHGVRFHFIVQIRPLGLAHAVKTARGFLDDSAFVMCLGDDLMQEPLMKYYDRFVRDGLDALILLKEVDNPQDYGVAVLDGLSGKIHSLVEKPKEPKSHLAVVGYYIFSSKIHEAIDRIEPSHRGELEITDAIQNLIERKGNVIGCPLNGWWIGINRVEDIGTATRLLQNGESC